MAPEVTEKSSERAGRKHSSTAGLLVVITGVEWVSLSSIRDLSSIIWLYPLEFNTLHIFFIAIHALAATISFFSGSFAMLFPNYHSIQRLFSLYLWSLIGMVIFLVGAMIAWWTVYTTIEQVVFAGLLGLAFYMVYRGFQARFLLQSQERHWRSTYIHHIGFTLISLFEGFIVVALINASAPGWLVALVAILGVIVGRRAIDIAESRHSTYVSKNKENPL